MILKKPWGIFSRGVSAPEKQDLQWKSPVFPLNPRGEKDPPFRELDSTKYLGEPGGNFREKMSIYEWALFV